MCKSLFRLVVVVATLVAGPAFAEEPGAVELEAPAPRQPHDGTIHQCAGPDGSRVYTDEPCESPEAQRAQQERERAESLDRSDDWICTADGGKGHGLLDAKRTEDLPYAQRAALASEEFVALRGTNPVRLGPLGSAHACVGEREVKVDPTGRILVRRGGLVRYVNDPATPAALQARCTSLLERCGGLDPGATLRTCIDETPVCAGTPPWNDPRACCPKACLGRFRNATRGNMDAKDAARAVFAGKSCL